MLLQAGQVLVRITIAVVVELPGPVLKLVDLLDEGLALSRIVWHIVQREDVNEDPLVEVVVEAFF